MISEHRAELLAERYRFNMGLLMGECGARGSPAWRCLLPPIPRASPLPCAAPAPAAASQCCSPPDAGDASRDVPAASRAVGGSCLWCPAPGTALGHWPPPAAGHSVLLQRQQLKPPGLARAPHPRGALCAGEARSRLRWADGKTIKNEVDLQVGVSAAGQVLSPVGAVPGVGPADLSGGRVGTGDSLSWAG